MSLNPGIDQIKHCQVELLILICKLKITMQIYFLNLRIRIIFIFPASGKRA